jgi:diacylglycerol kinase
MNRFRKSLKFAWHGLVYAFRYEKNFRIELFIAGGVIALAFFFGLTTLEKSILLSISALVLVMELANTALERVIDMLKPRVHPYARVVKDVMAGAVLLVSFIAVLIGVLIFLPYLLEIPRL